MSAPLLSAPALAADSRGISFLIVDLRGGATLASERPDIADRPILPGSVMKIAAIAAAMESGTIDERTRIVCSRSVVVDGHRLTCTHPDLHRALTPAEALTHSCDVYVATVAARLPRAAFDRALAGLGLPPSSVAASVQASALGLEGSRVPARRLMNAVVRIASQTTPLPWKPSTLDVLRLGLRNAAHDGTAEALGAAGIDALAKTGTVDAGGVSQGLVVGVTPSSNPTMGFTLIASGGAGRDAASLIAARLRSVSTSDAAAGRRRVDSSPSPGAAAGAEQRNGEVKPTPGSSPKGAVIRIGVAQPKGGYVVKAVPLDEYVAGVVSAEAASGSGAAALDAMAIAIRTYTLANRQRHAADGFDLCDLTHCQVLRTANRASRDAAVRTAGRYLSDRGLPANIFYTGSCGGF
ncbi:MAG: penicillin-binding transpeptidase domain-containing protein, partial [Vicinamibacterales bacterium]